MGHEAPGRPLIEVAAIGLVVGLLDGLAAVANAFLTKGTSPMVVFQYIASGVWGRAAFSDDAFLPFMGLVFHFFIAWAWTLLFYLAYPRIKWLSFHPIIGGMAYGLIVWAIMNGIVIPMSHVRRIPFDAIGTTTMIVIHMFVVGLTISRLVSKCFVEREKKKPV